MSRDFLLALLWTAGILLACSIPGRDLPDVDVVNIDKLVHFTLFAGFGALWMHAARSELRIKTRWVLLSGIALATLSEVYQGLMPFGRSPDPYDALANTLGLLVSLFAYHLWHRRLRST